MMRWALALVGAVIAFFIVWESVGFFFAVVVAGATAGGGFALGNYWDRMSSVGGNTDRKTTLVRMGPPPKPQPREGRGSGRLLKKREAPAVLPESGAVGGAQDPSDQVLFLLPVEQLTPTQGEGYMEIFRVSMYEAKLQLAKPLPRAIRSGPPEAIGELSDSLAFVDLPCLAIERRGLFPELRSLVVRTVQREGESLVMALQGEHELNRQGDESAEWGVLDLDKPFLLVVGRYEFPKRHTAGMSAMPFKAGGKIAGATRMDYVHFGHLYYEDSEVPYEFNEDQLSYDVLGEDKTASTRQNLMLLLDMISNSENATRYDSLLEHSNQVKQSFTGVGLGAAASIGTSVRAAHGVDVGKSNVREAAALSRALFFLWVTQRAGA